MAIELQLDGVRCNLKCTYCYQNPMRDAGNGGSIGAYDLEAVFRAMEAEGVGNSNGRGGSVGFTIFGGEPLLVPIEDIRRLCEYARTKNVPVGMQTNATLMTDAHFALFKEFRVGVGVSMDGPDELNDTRWNGDLASTRAMTAKSQAALERLIDDGHNPSLIVTVTRVNASAAELPRLVEWLRALVARGLRWINIHPLEVDGPDVAEHLALAPAEVVAAMTAIGAIRGANIVPIDAYRALLLGDDGEANCIWHACDPWTTAAVRGIDGAGTRQNCGRTNKDGVRWVKAETPGYERQLALYFTPQAYGGCAGCRFFYACKGECPGTAASGDWRSRTDHCAATFALFSAAEAALAAEGKEPLSQSVKRPLVEARMLEAWAAGRNTTIAAALAAGAACGTAGNRPHGDAPHGDAPHGDHTDTVRPVVAHGDHTDAPAGAREAK